MNYAEANKQLTGRCNNSKKLANNTYLIRIEDKIAVKLHETHIIILHPDGTTVVDTGGWKTATTKERLNTYMPHGHSIFQEKGSWFWGSGKPFTDGDVIGARGGLRLKRTDTGQADSLLKSIRAFAKLASESLPIEPPSGGDCWHCSMSGFPDSTVHLSLHMEEGYVVPSLVHTALKEANVGQLIISAVFHDQGRWTTAVAPAYVKRAVSKYLKKSFGLPR